jgi:hypothetical protein
MFSRTAAAADQVLDPELLLALALREYVSDLRQLRRKADHDALLERVDESGRTRQGVSRRRTACS